MEDKHCFLFFIIISFFSCHISGQGKFNASILNVDNGWANNSVNTVVFRKNSLVTYHGTQYIAYYNKDQYMVIGKRKSGDSIWQLKQTPFKGNASDAHNSISIMTDGGGGVTYCLESSW